LKELQMMQELDIAGLQGLCMREDRNSEENCNDLVLNEELKEKPLEVRSGVRTLVVIKGLVIIL
jgi:hypothetical protein